MELLFLGTGAADWLQPAEDGEFRGFTSTLVDGKILLDCTAHTLDKLTELGIPHTAVCSVFFTHSDYDHCDPVPVRALAAARRQAGLAPLEVYAEASWAQQMFPPDADWRVFGLLPGQEICCGNCRLLPLPSNHSGDYRMTRLAGDWERLENEISLHYVITQGDKTLLYALDGAWITTRAWSWLRHIQLDAWIADCTIGDGHAGDYRIFEHNSLPMIRLMAQTLRTPTPYGPPVLKEGAPIILNHLARTLHPTQQQLEQQLLQAAQADPAAPTYIAAFDGMRLTV